MGWRARTHPDEMRASMHQAMRPSGAAAATHAPHVRAVEQGAGRAGHNTAVWLPLPTVQVAPVAQAQHPAALQMQQVPQTAPASMCPIAPLHPTLPLSLTAVPYRMPPPLLRLSTHIANHHHCTGAVLVAAPWAGCLAVLQAPRGNLEAVTPRLLALAAVCSALAARDYGAAWQLATSQRVDVNLLVDFRWPDVLSHAQALASGLPGVDALCELLLALRPTSVLAPGGPYAALPQALGWRATTEMTEAAAAAAAQQQQQQPADSSSSNSDQAAASKVAAVCSALRDAALTMPRRFQLGYLKAVVLGYARLVSYLDLD